MRRDNINYLAVGFFVVLVGALLLIVLYKITGRTGPTDSYHVYYDNVSGIKYGTGVLYEGFRVGQVENIVPERGADGRKYKVEFSVLQGWEIPDNSIAKIVASGLLSAVAIDISEGDSKTLLTPGAELRGEGQLSLFAAIGDVAGDLKPLMKNLNQRITELSTEYTDLSASTLRPFVQDMQTRLDEFLIKLDDSAVRLQQLLGDENQEEISQFLRNIRQASANVDGLITRIEGTRQKLDLVLANLESLVDENQEGITAAVEDLQSVLDEIDDHVDAVMYHIEGGSQNMHEFTRHLRENPGVLLRGSPPAEAGVGQ